MEEILDRCTLSQELWIEAHRQPLTKRASACFLKFWGNVVLSRARHDRAAHNHSMVRYLVPQSLTDRSHDGIECSELLSAISPRRGADRNEGNLRFFDCLYWV